MIFRKHPTWSILLLCISFAYFACNSNRKDNEGKKGKPVQEEQKIALSIWGKINYPKGFKVTVKNDSMTETHGGGNLMGDSLHFKISDIAPNKVYYLLIEGRTDKWQERIPFFVIPGQDSLTLVGKPYTGYDSDSKMKFRIDASNEEQTLLNELIEAIENKRAAIDNQVFSGSLGGGKLQGKRENLTTAIPTIQKAFIAQRKPLITTMYLMTQTDDFRANAEQYEAIYKAMPTAVKQSVYGKDLESRFKIINNPPQHISLDNIQANDINRKALSSGDFPSADYFVLYFWASWDRSTTANANQLRDEAERSGKANTQWVFLSMDARYSDWEKTELRLPHNYLLKTESQKALVKDWYMTELPFLIMLDKHGRVMGTASSAEGLNAISIDD